MASSSRSCSSGHVVQISKKKRCKCGFVHLLTSHTKRNPGRRFWKCANWNKIGGEKCGYFKWEDETSAEEGEEGEEGEAEVKAPMQNVAHVCRSQVCQVCEALKRRVGKVKNKLGYERMKVRMLIAGCVASWAVTFGICLLSILGGKSEGKYMG